MAKRRRENSPAPSHSKQGKERKAQAALLPGLADPEPLSKQRAQSCFVPLQMQRDATMAGMQKHKGKQEGRGGGMGVPSDPPRELGKALVEG